MPKEFDNDESYVTVYRWMVTQLRLKGVELMVFSVIYGYTQSAGQFSGSLSYLAEWANSSRQQVWTCLQELLAKGLIVKRDIFQNGVKFVEYRSNYLYTPCKKVDGGVQETLTPPCKKVDGGVQETLHNNTIYNPINNIKDNIGSSREPTTPPTVEEVADYCRERGNHVDPQRFHDFYTIRKWRGKDGPIEDWRLIVRLWETNGVDDTKANKQSGFHGGSFDTDEMWAAALEKTYGG